MIDRTVPEKVFRCRICGKPAPIFVGYPGFFPCYDCDKYITKLIMRYNIKLARERRKKHGT